MRLIAAALLAVAAPAAGIALPLQEAGQATLSTQMAPLGALVGEWRGSGWMLLPNGERQTFESWERVTPRLSGNAMLVEGRHHATGAPERIVHDAMAMVTWDARANAYRMRTQLANGMGGDFPMEVGPGRFAWRMETPGGRIDYVAEFTADSWTERGTMTRAGAEPLPFFEMSLRRQ